MRQCKKNNFKDLSTYFLCILNFGIEMTYIVTVSSYKIVSYPLFNVIKCQVWFYTVASDTLLFI